jgi:hypothetical protein
MPRRRRRRSSGGDHNDIGSEVAKAVERAREFGETAYTDCSDDDLDEAADQEQDPRDGKPALASVITEVKYAAMA